MNENVIESIRIKYKKIFIIAWIIIAAMLIIAVLNPLADYGHYKDGRELAISITKSMTGKFDDIDDYNEMCDKMFEYYNPQSTTVVINGKKISNSASVKAMMEADAAFGRIMTEEGFVCKKGSDFLQHSNFLEFAPYHDGFIAFWSFGIILSIPLAIINLLYASSQKKMLVIEDDKIICKKGKKIAKEFFIRDVKTVELAKLKSLKILGNSIKYKIALVKNAEDIKNYIMDRIPVSTPAPAPAATPANQDFTAENLMKFKELLDQGVITEEEFEAKKKQLLGL